MSDLRPLNASISRLTSETFSKKFVALGRILNNWDDIIGSELAVKAQPVKIHYRKPKDKSEKPQATLDIATTSADATTLHYQKDLILARINQIFGDNWVTAIRFVHLPANTVEPAYKRLAPLKEEDIAAIHAVLEGIEDEEIRIRLEKLGQSILRKEKAKY